MSGAKFYIMSAAFVVCIKRYGSTTATDTNGHSKIVFTSKGRTRLLQGATYYYQLSAMDSLGRNISFLTVDLPSWLTFNAKDHSISGKPPKAGQYPVHVMAYAVNDTLHQRFMLTVYNKKTVNILCIGNSITNGTSRYNSYRRSLWQLLHNSGYNFDLVGSWDKHHMGGESPDPDFDMEHEGHSGWRFDHLFQPPDWDSARGTIDEWLKAYTPGIVLLELGTNDVFQCRTTADMIKDLEHIVKLFRQKNKQVKLFIAQIPPLGKEWAAKKLCGNDISYDKAIEELNKAIMQFGLTHSNKQSPLITVDQFSGVNTDTDMYDDIHPNEKGEQQMAKRWFDAIYTYLPKLN